MKEKRYAIALCVTSVVGMAWVIGTGNPIFLFPPLIISALSIIKVINPDFDSVKKKYDIKRSDEG